MLEQRDLQLDLLALEILKGGYLTVELILRRRTRLQALHHEHALLRDLLVKPSHRLALLENRLVAEFGKRRRVVVHGGGGRRADDRIGHVHSLERVVVVVVVVFDWTLDGRAYLQCQRNKYCAHELLQFLLRKF